MVENLLTMHSYCCLQSEPALRIGYQNIAIKGLTETIPLCWLAEPNWCHWLASRIDLCAKSNLLYVAIHMIFSPSLFFCVACFHRN